MIVDNIKKLLTNKDLIAMRQNLIIWTKNEKIFILYVVLLFCSYIYVMPYILTASSDPSPAVSAGQHAIILNEFYTDSDNSKTKPNIAPWSSFFPFDQNTDNHVLLPIYRALKVGTHLTNMGYNEGTWDTYTVDPLTNNDIKHEFNVNKQKISSQFYRKDNYKKQDLDLNYKSLYTTAYNNSAILVYEYIAKKIPNITLASDELIAKKQMTKVRYFMLFIYIVQLILLVLVLYKKYSTTSAIFVGIGTIIAPTFLFYGLTMGGFLSIFIFQIVYILLFHKMVAYNSSYKNKCIFILWFFILTLIQQYFTGVSSIFTTFGLAMAVLSYGLFITTNYLDKKTTIIEKLYPFMLPCLITFIVGVSMFILRYIEIQEATLLWGGDVSHASSFYKSSGYKKYDTLWIISVIKQCIIFFKFIFTKPLGVLLSALHINGPSFFSFKLYKIFIAIVLYLLIIYRIIGKNFFIRQKRLMFNIIIALVWWQLYLLLCTLLSPWYMAHLHLFAPIFGFYNMIIFLCILGYIDKGLKLYLLEKSNIPD